MALAFWDSLPADAVLDVEVFPNVDRLREPYPARFRYAAIDWTGAPLPRPDAPGLLVGDTPVTDVLGGWPLTFLSPRLQAFHDAGQPVDALGVGVEPLRSAEARSLFAAHYAPIRSWTVRSAACRDELLRLGVAEEKVLVGADWAWLYHPRRDLREWGASLWRGLGIDPDAPLLVANVVNEIWQARSDLKGAVAAALDELAGSQGLQVAFLCHEMRDGEFFDRAAAEATRERMSHPAPLVPNLYYCPDEVLGLLAHADVTLCGRYHFAVASVLAGCPPAVMVRSAKMRQLVEELELPSCGGMDSLTAEGIARAVTAPLTSPEPTRAALRAARERLAARASRNLPQALFS
jgi:polysaccharide pyruvyl transferase WcaK-like protein